MNQLNQTLEPTVTFSDNRIDIKIENRKRNGNNILTNFLLTVCGIIIGSIVGTIIIFIYHKLN